MSEKEGPPPEPPSGTDVLSSKSDADFAAKDQVEHPEQAKPLRQPDKQGQMSPQEKSTEVPPAPVSHPGKQGPSTKSALKSDLNGMLIQSVASGNHTDVIRLLKARAPVNAVNGSTSALHVAAAKGDADLCKMLLRIRADPNLENVNGEVPATLAYHGNHTECLRCFVKSTAPDTEAAPRKEASHGGDDDDLSAGVRVFYPFLRPQAYPPTPGHGPCAVTVLPCRWHQAL